MERHIEIVKMTSKGQLVIPQEVREELKLQEGERLMLFKEDGTIVLRPIKQMSKDIEEDLIEMKLAAEGWKALEEGKFVRKSKQEFLKELAKW